MLGGVASLKLTTVADAGPLLVTVWVYVMLLPGSTVGGAAAVLRARSAWAAVPTTSVATAELGPNDWLDAFTVTVSVIVVPAVTAAPTL